MSSEKKLSKKKYLEFFFALSSKLNLTAISFTNVQNCSITEISTGKDVGRSKDLDQTFSHSIFLPSSFSKLYLKYAVQGDILFVTLQSLFTSYPIQQCLFCSVTENSAVFMCLMKAFFLQLYVQFPQLYFFISCCQPEYMQLLCALAVTCAVNTCWIQFQP